MRRIHLCNVALLVVGLIIVSLFASSSIRSWSDDGSHLIKKMVIGTNDNSPKQHNVSQHQRVVVAVGPHKTGTSSVQFNLLKWSNANQLGDWVFAAPRNNHKAFGTLFMNLARTSGNRHPNQTLTDLYSETFNKVWKDGKNIVIASEYCDFVLRDSVDGDKVIESLLSMMPWASNEDITVVVTYRSPRIDHFISAWHWAGQGRPIRQWILDNYVFPHYLDPLGLARMYADHNLTVVILDTSGMQRDGVDISNVVACEVLDVPCNGSMMDSKLQPRVMNRIEQTPDLNATELSQIDELLRKFDCNYWGLLSHDRITVLHEHDLLTAMSGCTQNSSFSRSELLQSIKSLIQSGEHM